MTTPPARVRVWDLPTRIFHWAIVLLLPAMWWTAEEHETELHRTLGLVLLSLLLFRVLWGFVGSSTARFANFLKGPRGVLSYLSGRAVHVLGHNPLGGLSVAAMLGALLVQVGLGLFASDEDGLVAGPLSHRIGYDLAEEVTDLHEDWFYVILALVGVHVAAILFYAAVKRDDLVRPMLTGSRAAPAGAEGMRAAPWWRFVLAAALAGAATLWIAAGAPLAS